MRGLSSFLRWHHQVLVAVWSAFFACAMHRPGRSRVCWIEYQPVARIKLRCNHACLCRYLSCSSGPLLLGRGAAIHPRRFSVSATTKHTSRGAIPISVRVMAWSVSEPPVGRRDGCICLGCPRALGSLQAAVYGGSTKQLLDTISQAPVTLRVKGFCVASFAAL